MSVLNRKVLQLNSGWKPVGIVTVETAFVKLFAEPITVKEEFENGKVNIRKIFNKVADQDYITYTVYEWMNQPVLNDEDGFVLASHDRKIKIPEIIIMSKYSGIPKATKKWSRVRVLKRDGLKCQFCGGSFRMSELTIDHVYPRSRGGKSTWTNTVAACQKCNVKKADRTPKEAGMRLLNRPTVPTDLGELVSVDGDYPESWKPFLKQKG
jgi:5-methylcytosine-specific restriction endonuclease McrA